jgi:hypothetical protein
MSRQQITAKETPHQRILLILNVRKGEKKRVREYYICKVLANAEFHP